MWKREHASSLARPRTKDSVRSYSGGATMLPSSTPGELIYYPYFPPLYKMITHRSASIYPTTWYCAVGNLRCFLDVDVEEENLNPTCSNVEDQSSSSSHSPEPYIQKKSSICLDADKAQYVNWPPPSPRRKAKRVRNERATRAEKGRRYNKKPRAGEMKRTVPTQTGNN